ncbi:MAG: MBL fold metallo-hydrolase [Nitrospinae bacterium]|nr:MBL fold metallo-hydrolase [Nitrospinota bacterium]
MLRVCVLGSGSSGNSVFIGGEEGGLLLDAGFSLKDIKQRLHHAGINPLLIKGVVLSHEHTDHSKGAGVVCRALKIPLFANRGTHAAIQPFLGKVPEVVYFSHGDKIDVGGVEAGPFSIPHDAADPCGFVFRLNGASAAVVTDLGAPNMLVEDKLKNVDCVVLESNHDIEMLKAGPYPWALKQRIASRTGHLSNEACGELLAKIRRASLQRVILAHLSKVNNNPALARQMGEETLGGHGIPFEVAGQDTPLPPVIIE